jgi:SAM-dependent methyltransferase
MSATHQEWEDLASLDPLFAVLSHPDTRGGGWNPDRFFDTGQSLVSRLMARAAELGRPVGRRTALDFGCGVGRLTRWLAPHFASCLGLDVAPTMVAEARRLNAAWPGCRFEVAPPGGLSAISSRSFDLVLCKSVIQHLPSQEAMLSCVYELARLVAGEGLLVVHVPSTLPWRRRLQVAPRMYRLGRALGLPRELLYGRLGLTPIRMRTLGRTAVEEAIGRAGGRLLGRDARQDSGGDELYYATR